MKLITKENALQLIEANKQMGNHINSRLENAISTSDALFLFDIQDKESFLSLIWIKTSKTMFLTPDKLPRTLYDVTQRLIHNGYTFEDLINGNCDTSYNPVWFRSCAEIDKHFDYDR